MASVYGSSYYGCKLSVEAYTRRTSVMTSRSGHGQTNKEDHQSIWQAPSGDKSSLWYNLPKLCTDVVVTATHS